MGYKHNTRYAVWDGSRWAKFTGISQRLTDSVVTIDTNSSSITCTPDHPFILSDGSTKKAADLEPMEHIGDYVQSITPSKTTTSVFELCGTQNGRYIVNGNIRSHNCDELAFVKDSVAEEFWASISPTLSTGGSCMIASTPNGDSNLFAQLWRGAKLGTNGFFPIEVKLDEIPDRGEDFRQAEIGRIGMLKFRQEYLCEFLGSSTGFFDLDVDNIVKSTVSGREMSETVNEVTIFKPVALNRVYVVGVDVASGNGGDFTSVEVFEFPLMDQVLEWRSNEANPASGYLKLKKILNYLASGGYPDPPTLNDVYFSVENNGIGESILTAYELDEERPDAVLLSKATAKRTGMHTTDRTKIEYGIIMQNMIKNGRLIVRSHILHEEIRNFETGPRGVPNAKKGGTDDCIMATMIAVRVTYLLAEEDATTFAAVHNVSDRDFLFKPTKDTTDDDDDNFTSMWFLG